MIVLYTAVQHYSLCVRKLVRANLTIVFVLVIDFSWCEMTSFLSFLQTHLLFLDSALQVHFHLQHWHRILMNLLLEKKVGFIVVVGVRVKFQQSAPTKMFFPFFKILISHGQMPEQLSSLLMQQHPEMRMKLKRAVTKMLAIIQTFTLSLLFLCLRFVYFMCKDKPLCIYKMGGTEGSFVSSVHFGNCAT